MKILHKNFLILIFFIIFTGCDSKSSIWKIFEEEDLLKHPKSERCADCHQYIYDQWKQSIHSKAYISESYKKATNHYSKSKCLSCHIPLELSKGEKPQIRTFNKEDGVNCVSCHFSSKENAMIGPYNVFSPPHPSKKDKDFKDSLICSSCHQKTYSQWKKASLSKTCQDCHMQPVEKKDLIQKFPFQYFHLAKYIYSHTFNTGIAKRDNFSIEIEKKNNAVLLKIKNKSIPHNLPTADNGKPKFYLIIEAFYKSKKIEQENIILTPKYALMYNKNKTFEIEFLENFDKVKVSLYRKLSWEKEKKFILSLEKQF